MQIFQCRRQGEAISPQHTFCAMKSTILERSASESPGKTWHIGDGALIMLTLYAQLRG